MAGYIFYLGRGLTLAYDQIDALITQNDTASRILVSLPNNTKPLVIPDMALLSDNGMWVYVSKQRPLPHSYTPHELVTVSLPFHSADSQAKLQPRVLEQLTKLFTAATTDGKQLVVSSAYRSIDDQQRMLDDFIAKKGEALARQYVSDPGNSEHHTGLAVDINDDSAQCQADANKCSLSPSSAAWLADAAPQYGFIIRYPSGAQPVTGIAYEPWHLRYVGVTLAQRLTASELTFDEFIQQAAPGRSRSD